MNFKPRQAPLLSNESRTTTLRTAALRRRFWLNFTTFQRPIASDSRCQPLPLAKGIDYCYTALVELLAWRMIMKQIFAPFLLLANFAGPVCAAVADTIRLKDGSVIRGQVIGFKSQQFTVLIVRDAGPPQSHNHLREDIDSIEFDSATTAAATALANEGTATTGGSTAPVYQPPRTNPPADTSNNAPPRISNQTLPSGSPTFFNH